MRIKLLDRCCREQGADQPRLFGFVLGLARDLGLRATGRLHGRTGRALLGLRTDNDRATRPRARRAGTNLAGLVACTDTGRAGGNRGFQDVSRHVRRGRALTLKHIATHIGLGWARGDRRLQHILGPINLRALGPIMAFAFAVMMVFPTDLTSGLRDINEPFPAGASSCNHVAYNEAQH